MPKKNHTRSVTSSNAKTGLGVVFLTIFIDLVGFSIIFPLFPDMLDYYIGKEANGEGFLSKMLSRIPTNLWLQDLTFGQFSLGEF